MELLNGAFTADLVKGKWVYTVNLKKLGKRPIKKGSLVEKPQFPVLVKLEAAASKRYQETLRSGVLDLTKYLKSLQK